MNEIQLIGRWTKDHDLRFTADGKAVLKSTLAVNRKFDREKADFLRIVMFEKTAQATADYTRKGSLVAITGRVQTGSYENEQGQRIYTTDVIANSVEFLETRSEQQNEQNSTPNYQSNTNYQQNNQTQYNANTEQSQPFGNSGQFNQQQDPFASGKGPIEVSEDDLPFDFRQVR